MASEIRVNKIINRSGLSTVTFSNTGTIVSGIVTADSFSAASGTITGNLGVGGVLTYEDVTNIDSVGVITARSGIDAASNLLLKTGGTERVRITSTGNVGLGTITPVGASGKTLDISGGSGQARIAFHNDTTGYASGDGSQIFSDGNTLGLQARESAGIIQFETAGGERLRIGSAGQLGIAGANYGTSGQVLTSGGASAAPTWATPSSGLSMADQWRLTNTQVVSTQDVLLTNWERPDTSGTGGGAYIGSGMSNSSGTFSFPVTGIYLITFEGCFNGTNNTRYSQIDIMVTKNNSNYYDVARSFFYYNRSTGTSTGASASCSFIMDVDNISNDKVRFTSSQDNIGQHQVIGDSTVNTTTVTFLRLGNT